MSKCDIIIPIYNAYDFVKKCVDSVLKYTDFNEARIILIDDKSPDSRILPLLKQYEKKNPKKIVLLVNEENLGFVKTVNKGMKFSKNDVLLLNSDTEVTSGWLEKIRNLAYRDERIATVTPLSNNATLASVPKFNQYNELPEGYNAQKMAKIIEKYSMHIYPEIPSAHGFCMYIKRSVLNLVGFFDEEKFGKGYGEEVDFSFRCLEKGYKNVLCDDAYVFHSGAASFLTKGSHDDELWKKYPKIRANTDEWYREKNIEIIGNNIALALMAEEKNINILLIGNESKVNEIKKIIRKKRECLVYILKKEKNYYRLISLYDDYGLNVAIYERPVVVFGREEDGLEYQSMVRDIVENFKITIIFSKHFSDKKGEKNRSFNVKAIDLPDEITEKWLTRVIEKNNEKKRLCYPEVRSKMLQCSLTENLLRKQAKEITDEMELKTTRNNEEKKENLTFLRRIYLKIRYILRGY